MKNGGNLGGDSTAAMLASPMTSWFLMRSETIKRYIEIATIFVGNVQGPV